MKRLFLVVIACMAMSPALMAQKIELTPMYGYQLGAKLDYGPGYLKITDGSQYGVTLNANIRDGIAAELSWWRQDAELRLKDKFDLPLETRLSDVAVDYFLLGAVKYAELNQFRPFAGFSGGLVIFTPNNENQDVLNRSLSSSTKFAFTFTGGIKYMISEKVGIRIQGQLLFPVEWGGIYVGIGTGGPSTGASLGSTIIQGAFSGGLIIGLGGE